MSTGIIPIVDNSRGWQNVSQRSQEVVSMATAAKTAPDMNDVFAGLAIEPSSEPLPEPSRGGTSGPNPFTQPLAASVEHNSPYNFYVPTEAVQRAVFLINSAARKQNVGVRVIVNVKRDKNGKIVKGSDGKSQPQPETDGPNSGKVLIRFQALKERKQQKTPRPYSIVKDKSDTTGSTYIVRRRADKVALFKGTQEEAKAEYDRLKTAFLNTPQAQQTETPQPQQPAAVTETPTEEQSAAPAASPAGDAAA